MNGTHPELERNSAAQGRNNQARLELLRREAPERFIRVFDQVPAALQVNQPEVVGYVPDPETPHGLRGFERQLWRPPADREAGAAPAPRPVVEGLYLIGSSGSVGHNPDSDLDWWICFEDGAFTPRGFGLFQRKLAGIKEWADREFGVDTSFYCMNLADLARGSITRPEDAETEGEVAPLLLLEEFYRTFILVAGRPPLWPVLPPDLTPDSYQAAAAGLALAPGAAFLDLGFPALPRPQEVLAAALWLAHKSEAEPLKGLIKLTALLEYVENDFQCPLLCAEVKATVLGASEDDLPIDPYVMTIERVTDFGRSSLPPIQSELLRAAAVLKVLGAATRPPAAPPPPLKRLILEKWLDRWGWPLDRLEHFAAYGRWAERERLELNHEFLQTLVRLYIRIANRLTSAYAKEIDPQSKELAPFAARLLTRQAGLEATLESLPAKRRHRALEGRLFLRPAPETGLWTLHALTAEDEAPGADNIIYTCRRAARAAAWLVHNQFSRAQTDRLALLPAPDGRAVELGDLPGLLDELAAFFPPLDFSREEDVWAARPQGLCLLILNFEEAETDDLAAVDLISRTGWGEMRHEYLGLAREDKRADRYLKTARLILKSGGTRPENLVFHSRADSHEARQAAVNIRGALTALIKRQADSADLDPRSRRIDL